jgi:hypothetical protein
VVEDRCVDVDPAQALDALRLPEDLEPGGGLAQYRRVEGAAPEVVHGHHRTGIDALLPRVERRRGLGLGGVGDRLLQPRKADRLAQQVCLVRPPVRRMGHAHGRRRATFAGRDSVDHGPQQAGHQRLGRVRHAAEQDRCRIAQAALELPGHPVWFAQATPARRLAGDHGLVRTKQDDRRDDRGAATE